MSDTDNHRRTYLGTDRTRALLLYKYLKVITMINDACGDEPLHDPDPNAPQYNPTDEYYFTTSEHYNTYTNTWQEVSKAITDWNAGFDAALEHARIDKLDALLLSCVKGKGGKLFDPAPIIVHYCSTGTALAWKEIVKRCKVKIDNVREEDVEKLPPGDIINPLLRDDLATLSWSPIMHLCMKIVELDKMHESTYELDTAKRALSRAIENMSWRTATKLASPY